MLFRTYIALPDLLKITCGSSIIYDSMTSVFNENIFPQSLSSTAAHKFVQEKYDLFFFFASLMGTVFFKM